MVLKKGLMKLLELASRMFKYGNIASFVFSGAGIVMSLALWFIPKLSDVTYTEDNDWSMLYLVSSCVDFGVF